MEAEQIKKEFEPPAKFAKRVGLPDNLIRALVKQGQLPHIISGKRNAYICVKDGLEALRQYAGLHTADIAARMPVPIKLQPRRQKTSSGRQPDSVRLAKSQITL